MARINRNSRANVGEIKPQTSLKRRRRRHALLISVRCSFVGSAMAIINGGPGVFVNDRHDFYTYLYLSLCRSYRLWDEACLLPNTVWMA